MKNNKLQTFFDADLEASSLRLANEIIAKLRQKINFFVKNKSQQKIFIALSGGNTPKNLFNLLAKNITKTEWQFIEIFQVDERCVTSAGYNITNRKLIQETLLKLATSATCHFIKLLNANNNPTIIAREYQQKITERFEKYNKNNFDFIILGMGNDGHTASIFPTSKLLKNITNKLVSSTNAPTTASPQVPRITLTYQAINNAENIYILLNGAEKINLLKSPKAKNLPIGKIKSSAKFFLSP